MSIKRVIICDQCGANVAEEAAYSVVVRQGDDKEIIITKGVGNGGSSHVCGSECLLKFISNNLVCL